MGMRGYDPKLQSRVLEVKALVEKQWYTSDMAKHFEVGDGTMKRFLKSMGWPHITKYPTETAPNIHTDY